MPKGKQTLVAHPTSLSAPQDQPANTAPSSSKPQASAKRKEREEVNPVGESSTRRSTRKNISSNIQERNTSSK